MSLSVTPLRGQRLQYNNAYLLSSVKSSRRVTAKTRKIAQEVDYKDFIYETWQYEPLKMKANFQTFLQLTKHLILHPRGYLKIFFSSNKFRAIDWGPDGEIPIDLNTIGAIVCLQGISRGFYQPKMYVFQTCHQVWSFLRNEMTLKGLLRLSDSNFEKFFSTSMRNECILQECFHLVLEVLGTESSAAMMLCFRRRRPHTLLSVDNYTQI